MTESHNDPASGDDRRLTAYVPIPLPGASANEDGWPFRLAFTTGSITLLLNSAFGTPFHEWTAFFVPAVAALFIAIALPFAKALLDASEVDRSDVCRCCGQILNKQRGVSGKTP